MDWELGLGQGYRETNAEQGNDRILTEIEKEIVTIYTDGSCPENSGAAEKKGRAGWGISIYMGDNIKRTIMDP